MGNNYFAVQSPQTSVLQKEASSLNLNSRLLQCMSVKRLCAAFLAYFLPVARQHRSRKINEIESKGGSAATREFHILTSAVSRAHFEKISTQKCNCSVAGVEGRRRRSAGRCGRALTPAARLLVWVSAPGARLLPEKNASAGRRAGSQCASLAPPSHSL